MAIIKLKPTCKDYLWGGNKLKEEYNKESNLEVVAETWELSNHKDGQSYVVGGLFDGLSFQEYIEQAGDNILGSNCSKFTYFPILIKLIDADKSLSIQVHPDNEYAREVENEFGKTEMWYVLDCKEGAFLYYGFSRDISKEELRERIMNNTLLDVLNKVEVKKGDVFFIEAGTIHAIGEGIVICEIQQNSNSTYRVYDYGRRDKDGNTRELHIDKALDVTNVNKTVVKTNALVQEKTQDYENDLLASCEYFTTNKIDVINEYSFQVDETSFVSMIVTEGECSVTTPVNEVEAKKGDSIFVPAMEGVCTVKGNCQLVITRV